MGLALWRGELVKFPFGYLQRVRKRRSGSGRAYQVDAVTDRPWRLLAKASGSSGPVLQEPGAEPAFSGLSLRSSLSRARRCGAENNSGACAVASKSGPIS